ncbi:hypothetical protein C0992_010913 [Termitomyces sp. T32_za158]|nr:hypothetical protein C0992_010913 [Termitomyces sp. T32_za158]
MAQEIREQFIGLFKRLDTTREKNIRQIIESHHGARNSINDNQVLQRLLQISEEDTSDQSGIGIETLNATRKSLERELVEDVKEALSQNSTIFQGKLDILLGQINDGNDKLSKVIVSVSALSGGYEKIVDPQIQSIWKDMGWKSHTKTRHFVNALHDSHLYKGNQITDDKADGHDYDDKWAVSYLSTSYLQAISEAIDDDGSGFINVEEVNSFTKSKPREWSLLQWLAYWAAGWRADILRYHRVIHYLLYKMYDLRNRLRPANRQALDRHLYSREFQNLELLLHSTSGLGEEILLPAELRELQDQYTRQEEKRMHDDLQKIAYIIDSSATVSLVTGQGRIERSVDEDCDNESGTLEGHWAGYCAGWRSDPCRVTRTPPHLVRFRYAEDDFEKDRARARWNFARAAVLHEVKRQRFSKDFVITTLRENRRLKELTITSSMRGTDNEEFEELRTSWDHYLFCDECERESISRSEQEPCHIPLPLEKLVTKPRRMHTMLRFMDPDDDQLVRLQHGWMVDVKDRVRNIGGKMENVEDKMGNVQVRMGNVEDKMNDIKDKMSDIKDEMGDVKDKMGSVEDKMGSVEDKMGSVEDKMGSVEDKMGSVEDRMGKLEKELKESFEARFGAMERMMKELLSK